ncbi:MAG: hypothetical protein LBV67_12430 [Streptococcaceae bacterium]|jgi:hypothetical protein|nr:hypothetical protein [Streptococcaceae bacterium]
MIGNKKKMSVVKEEVKKIVLENVQLKEELDKAQKTLVSQPMPLADEKKETTQKFDELQDKVQNLLKENQAYKIQLKKLYEQGQANLLTKAKIADMLMTAEKLAQKIEEDAKKKSEELIAQSTFDNFEQMEKAKEEFKLLQKNIADKKQELEELQQLEKQTNIGVQVLFLDNHVVF